MKIKLFFLVAFFFFSFLAKGQYTTTHHIAPAPWQYWSNANEIVISTTEADTQDVTIDLFRSNGTFITTLTIPMGNSVISYIFQGSPLAAPRNQVGTTYNDRGLIVEASAPVLVNLRNIASDTGGTDANNIKGNASLVSLGGEGMGTNFRLGYYRSSYGGLVSGGPIYSVMAIENFTEIYINGVFQYNLNAGQSRMFQAPMGALLASNGPVVVNTGSYGDTPLGCGGSGQDGTFTQIAPVEVLGNQYMVVRGNGVNNQSNEAPEQTTVIATEDVTTLAIIHHDVAGNQVGAPEIYTLLNAGDFESFLHGDGQNQFSKSYILSDKPVTVYAGTAVQCETDVSLVLPIGGCSGFQDIRTRKFIDYNGNNLPYFCFIIIESETDPVFINGNDIEFVTGNPRTEIGTTGFYLLNFTNAQIGNPDNLILTSDSRLTTSIVQQGGGFSMSAYYSSFNTVTAEPELYIEDCAYYLLAPDGYNSYIWYLDGVIIDGETQQTIQVTDSGSYSVSGIRNCGEALPSSAITINDPQVEFALPDFNPELETIAVCSDEAFEIFDLNAVFSNITNLLESEEGAFEVALFESEEAAENNEDSIDEADFPEYQTETSPQTIWVRIQDENGCYVLFPFDLITNPNPIPGNVEPLQVCDPNNDGIEEFDLEVAEIQILDSQDNMTVSFYESEDEANIGDSDLQLPLLYTNTTSPFSQIIFAKLEDDLTGCYTLIEVILETLQNPEITNPITDFMLCDDDQDGFEVFDLISKEDEILDGLTGVVVSFYNTLADAQEPDNAIIEPESYTSGGGEVIFVRVENVENGCYSIGQFYLVIYDLPFSLDPEPLEVCDDATPDGVTEFDLSEAIPGITGGDTNLTVSFHIDQTSAIEGIDPLPLMFSNTEPFFQTLHVRVRDLSTGCFVLTTLDLFILEAPAVYELEPLTYCDIDNDGIGYFDLTLADAQVTDPGSGHTITYHETPENAQTGSLPLESPYMNIETYNQIVYVRVFDPIGGCYNMTTLELIVYDSPQLIAPEPLIGCDDNNDGIAIFDLTQVADGIFGNYGEDWDTLFSIFYYETQNDADNGTNPIPNPGSYANLSNPQTIYIVAEDLDNECQKQTTLTLIVNPAPELNEPDPLELCDYNEPAGVEEFNLALAIPQITGGDTGIGVSFHLTQAEADNNENPLPLLYTNAEPYAQTLFVRATNATTGCSASTVTLTLRVNPLPSPEAPEPLVVCDTNTNGFSLFDLESKTDEILNGEADVIITYHELLFHAEEGIFAIDTDELYENIIPFEQTIYVRAENTITGCYTIVELLLIVEDAPTIPLILEDLIACSEGQEEIGVLFDLTEHLEAIYGEQSDEDFSVTFHISEEDAENQDNAIANPESYPNIVNPQQIWYVLSNDETGCGNIGHFWLRVELSPDITQPEAYSLCDTTADEGFAIFNLTTKNPEIVGVQSWLDVQYYENEIDAIEGNEANRINPDTTYENTTPYLQLLYVRVVDIDTGCEAQTTLLLRVLNNPDIITPEPLEACDDTDPGNGIESFNLRDRETEILNGEIGVTVTYHESYEAAVAGTPAIDDPEDYEMTEAPQQIIYVRVTYDTTGCYSIVELLLIVHPLPQVEPGDIPDYILCLIPAVEQASFNLLEKRQEILDLYAPNQDDYQVTFHLEEAWAEAGIQSIPEFQLGNYLNQSNPQTIYYRIEHILTGCANVGSFTLEIREGATITAPTAPLETCEDEQGSGIGTFNLTQLNSLLLGGQDPDVYQVTYHESEEDANATDANDTAIPNPESYQSGNAVIWGRVTNNDGSSQGLCYEITPITLQVNPLPEISLLSEYRLCVDEDGNAIQEEFGEQSPPLIDTGLDINQYSFVWLLNDQVLFGENGSSIVVTQEGEYTVIVTDITTGCENQMSTTVILSSPPLDYGAETTSLAFANEHVIEAWAEGLGEYMFQLNDGPFQDEGYWTGMSPGIHVVTITDINGCGSVQIEVGVIDYPLFFTPNDDGYHDTWNIIGISALDPTARIYIFDRHGKLLKQLSPTGPGWDGTYNGNPLPSSDYWFRVEYNENERARTLTGHFTLKR